MTTKRQINLENLLKSVGVPERYRYVRQLYEPRVLHAGRGDTMKRISISDQLDMLETIKNRSLDYPYVLGISSFPTDKKAMEVMVNLLNRELAKDPIFDVSVIDICQASDIVESAALKKPPKVIVIHNLTETSTPGRLQKARDLISVYNESFVMVVIATKDILSFFDFKLQHPVDCILYF